MANEGRVLWYNPNPSENFIPSEDLNIFVNLYVETKGRSMIAAGKTIVNPVKNNAKISFLSGTKSKKDDKPYLTTDYSNLQSYNLNEDDDYSEMLGIETINIDFNTSMAPMIKIKLIDVRGAAIFGQNGKGKYDFFFQMPYPLFHLELKGYYGYPIEYCLHLTRFNTNFNSQTGNFEIECDFIGYTYALLNDMQMGLLRACEKTKRGQKIFNSIKSEYKDPTKILTIDEAIKKTSSNNDATNKIKRDDADVKAISKIDLLISDSNKLNETIITLLNDINTERGDSSKIKGDYYMYDVVVGDGKTIQPINAGLIDSFNKTQDKIIADIKANLTSDLQPKFTQILNDDGSKAKTHLFYAGNVSNTTNNINIDYDTSFTNNRYVLPTEIEQYTKDKPYYNNIKNIIINELKNTTNGYENNTNYFWDFILAHDKINEFISVLYEEKNKLERQISEKTKKQLNQKYGFDSSIRNLFRVLTTGVEVFLTSMMEVSKEAEESEVRKTELNKLTISYTNDTSFNNQVNSSSGDVKIYPWPEYRAKKDIDGSYYEKYLGIDADKNKVPELLFTEELINIMITQAKDDRVYLNGSVEGNNVGKNLWWPISVVDGNIPIGTQGKTLEVNKNPYEVILSTPGELYSSYSDSSKLLMILRGFLLLGFANRNKISDDLITLHAKLEAWNLKTAIDNVVRGDNKFNLKKILNNLTYDIIKKFGRENVIFQVEGGKFKYSWIYGDTDKTYLPINKGFNKVKFKENGRIKNEDAIKLKESGYLFVGHDYFYKPSKANDGAIYVNIIDADKVDGKNHVPTFGQQSLEAVGYSTNFAGKKISYTDFRSAIKDKNNTTKDENNIKLYVNPLDANKSINVYDKINYSIEYNKESENPVGDDLGNLTTLPLFFADIPNGYSYNSIIVRFDEDVYKTNTLFYKGWGDDENKEINLYTTGDYTYVQLYNTHNPLGFRTKLVDVILKNGKHTIPFIGYNFNSVYKHSLFGSAFYYSQYTTPEEIKKNYPQQTPNELKETAEKLTRYKKALLFLHCFPFQGVVKPYRINEMIYSMFDGDIDNTKVLGLKALFTAHNGLIKAPKVWPLFIGGILWRLGSSDDPINFDVLGLDKKPFKDVFLYSYSNTNKDNPYCGMNITQNESSLYSKIDDVLINLPKQVKNEFINYFISWVNNEFKTEIQKELEIGGGSITFDDFEKIRNKYKTEIQNNSIKISKAKAKTIFLDKLKVDNYNNIGVDTEQNGNNFIMELNPNSKIMTNLLDLVSAHSYIQNINPRIWSKQVEDKYDPIFVEPKQFELYSNEFIKTFKTLVGDELTKAPEEEKEIKTELFGTADNDDIRLNVYRTLMAIYQKWISGTYDGKFFSQCMVHPDDKKVGEFERNNADSNRLIESFKFVDRAYFDIGDRLYIDPKAFSDLIVKNKGATFFDVSNRILNDNNFLFLPLPSFVNFNNIDDLKKLFEPQNMSDREQGPAFVCVYAGQISNHLDLSLTKDDTVYKDDGIYITLGDNGKLYGLPEDFNSPIDDSNPYEMNVPVFAVNFGQQNQNLFKDVKLDQKEFSETAESLEVIQDLSNQGDKTQVSNIGQNLFNVYQKRSYSCEVEMMGNLAIQPLMYFQLNNVPMFKGLYLIIKVSHTVKANSVSTTFKGVRVKKTKTPLIEENTVLLNNVSVSPVISSSSINNGGGGGGTGNVGYADSCQHLDEMQYNSGFWMYLSHQQGPTGALKHYEALYKGGDYSTFPKAKGLNSYQTAIRNTRKNVYYNSCTDNLKIANTEQFIDMVTNEPQKFAKAYIESSWVLFNKKKNSLITKINGNDKIRTNDKTYKEVYDILIANKGLIGFDVSDYDLGTYWDIENGLNTDTKNIKSYATMFQLNKVLFKDIISGLEQAPSNKAGYTNYPNIQQLCEKYYPRLGANFKANVGKYFIDVPQNSSPNNSNSSSKNGNIIIGDSIANEIGGLAWGIKQNGDNSFETFTKLQLGGINAGTFWNYENNFGLQFYNNVDPNINNVVLSLGTNDAYNTGATWTTKVIKVIDKLKTVFPNAKFMVVKGGYGNKLTCDCPLQKAVKEPQVVKFYKTFKDRGFTIIEPAVGNVKDVHGPLPIYKNIGADIIANKK